MKSTFAKRNFFSASLVILAMLSSIVADVKSTNGQIKFDVDGDGSAEMTMTTEGLGIGISSPSANLHVAGNAIIQALVVGGTTNPSSSNLHIHGSVAYSIQNFATGGNTIGNSSMIMADTSTGNALLQLPSVSDTSSRFLTIKRTSILNELYISGFGNSIDGYSSLVFSAGNMTAINLMNQGGHWYVMANGSQERLTEVGSDNILLWWKLEQTSGNVALDSSSSGMRSGNLLNNHSFSGNSINGTSQLGLQLSNDLAQVTNEGSVLPPHAYSYCLWTKYNHATSDAINFEPEISGSAGFVWASGNAMFHKSCYHKKVDGTYISAGLSDDLLADNWYHIAVTWNGNDLKLFLNGEYKSGNVASDWISSSNISVTNPGLYSESVSSVDDVRFYSKALTADDVKALYYAGQP